MSNDPAFTAKTNAGLFRSSHELKQWVRDQSAIARGKGYENVKSAYDPVTGDTTVTAWAEPVKETA